MAAVVESYGKDCRVELPFQPFLCQAGFIRAFIKIPSFLAIIGTLDVDLFTSQKLVIKVTLMSSPDVVLWGPHLT